MTGRATAAALAVLALATGTWAPAAFAETRAIATFAGGCFWCMEEAFDAVPGVLATTSGYTGGDTKAPTYEQVSEGRTGHYEALRVVYDAEQVSYQQLLVVFWHNVDPLDDGGQFCDRGPQYRTAIFAHDDEQLRLARESRAFLGTAGGFDEPVVTPIGRAGIFHPAEDSHQDYHRRNPLRYKAYKYACGRAARLQELWGER
jgi:peptide-methionine (S)-S-oxide reductase